MKNNFLAGLVLTTGVLYLSGTLPKFGYTIKNNIITADANYILIINGVETKTAKLSPNTDYTVSVERLN